MPQGKAGGTVRGTKPCPAYLRATFSQGLPILCWKRVQMLPPAPLKVAFSTQELLSDHGIRGKQGISAQKMQMGSPGGERVVQPD